jgi:hypothetical protein
MSASTNKPDFFAYGVTPREKGKKDILTQIGAAWNHEKGGGLSIDVRALPLNFNGKIVLFPPKAATAEAPTDDYEPLPY